VESGKLKIESGRERRYKGDMKKVEIIGYLCVRDIKGGARPNCIKSGEWKVESF
jgi:hypothetical protein